MHCMLPFPISPRQLLAAWSQSSLERKLILPNLTNLAAGYPMHDKDAARNLNLMEESEIIDCYQAFVSEDQMLSLLMIRPQRLIEAIPRSPTWCMAFFASLPTFSSKVSSSPMQILYVVLAYSSAFSHSSGRRGTKHS